MSYSVTAGHGITMTIGGPSNDEAGRRVALEFGTQHEPTNRIKTFCAGAMKAVIEERDRIKQAHLERCKEIEADGRIVPQTEIDAYNDAMRCFATALTHYQTGSIFAVGALHAKANADTP